jgi:hypothetical protein
VLNNPLDKTDPDGHTCKGGDKFCTAWDFVFHNDKRLPAPPPPSPAPKPNAAANSAQGVVITYSQRTGMTSILTVAGSELPLGIGYAGHGASLNNPDNQYVQGENAGPPPEGMYQFGPMQDYTIKTGPHKGEVLTNAMTLTPERGTFMGVPPRGGLLSHGGDFTNFNSSSGCEVLRPDVRTTINQLHIHEEVVIP